MRMTLAKVAKEAVLGLVKGNDAETNEAGDDDASLFVSGSGNALDLSSRLISAHLDRVIPHEQVRGRGDIARADQAAEAVFRFMK